MTNAKLIQLRHLTYFDITIDMNIKISVDTF